MREVINMAEKKEEEYSEKNMQGMEQKRISQMLEALIQMKLAIHSKQSIKSNPEIVIMCADLEMELYITIDAYLHDANKEAAYMKRLEEAQEQAMGIERDYSVASNEGEDYDNPEQLWCYYKMVNSLHRDLLKEIEALGLRIPFGTKEGGILKHYGGV